MIAEYFDIPNSAFELRPVFANPPFNPAVCGTNFALPSFPTFSFLLPTFDRMAGFVLVRFWLDETRMPQGQITAANTT